MVSTRVTQTYQILYEHSIIYFSLIFIFFAAKIENVWIPTIIDV